MKTGRFCAGLAGLATLFAVALPALGDAPCNKDFRDVTAPERARITTATEAAKSALPPAPEGWQVRGEGPHSVGTKICRDRENNPWQYGYSRSYNQVANAEARQKIMQDAAAASAALQARNQARMDALQAQMMSIMQQQMALNQKRDYAGAEKLQPQLEKVQAEYEKLATAGSAGIEAAGREFERDLEMSISVNVNAAAQQPEQTATKLPLPAGAVAAVRWKDADPQATDEHALYLFGAWKQRAEGGWSPGARAGVAPSGPHAVSVYVTADRDRLANVVQTIDFAKIAAIAK